MVLKFYALIFCSIFLGSIPCEGAQEIMGKALVQDELKSLFKQGVLGSNELQIETSGASDKHFTKDQLLNFFKNNAQRRDIQQQLTSTNLCNALLEIYHLIHKAYIMDKNYIGEDSRKALRTAINRLKKLNKQPLGMDQYNILRKFRQSLNGMDLDALLKNGNSAGFYNACMDFILAITHEVPTQLEKSVRIHFGKNNPGQAWVRSDASGNAVPFDWQNLWKNYGFIQFLKGNFFYNDQNTPTVLNDDAYVTFFQTLLIREKLNPDCFVFYHSATVKMSTFHMFQDLIARFLQQTGNPFNIKSYVYENDKYTNYNNVSYTVKSPVLNVDDLINEMWRIHDGDTGAPFSKYLTSSSYSIFGGGKPSAKQFFQYSKQYNFDQDLFSTIYQAFSNAIGIDIIQDPLNQVNTSKNKYGQMFDRKFRNLILDNHPGHQKNGYLEFPIMWQFFIPKAKVDDIVYFGGMDGIRHRNKSNNSHIKEVLDAFIHPKDDIIYDYYNAISYRGGGVFSLDELDQYQSWQGKIGVGTKAYFDATVSGEIKLYPTCLRPDQYIILDDLRDNMQYMITEDIMSALEKGGQTPNLQNSTLAKALQKIVGGGKSISPENVMIAANQRHPEAKDLPTVIDIIDSQKLTLQQLTQALIQVIDQQNWSKKAKINHFIQEYMIGLYHLKYKGQCPPPGVFLTDLQSIMETTTLTDNHIVKLRYVELFREISELIGHEKFITEQLTDILSGNNPHLPISSRAANTNEKKMMVFFLREIAYMLLKKKDNVSNIILNKFYTSKNAPGYLKNHKEKCLSILSYLLENIQEVAKIQCQDIETNYNSKSTDPLFKNNDSGKRDLSRIQDQLTKCQKENLVITNKNNNLKQFPLLKNSLPLTLKEQEFLKSILFIAPKPKGAHPTFEQNMYQGLDTESISDLIQNDLWIPIPGK